MFVPARLDSLWIQVIFQISAKAAALSVLHVQILLHVIHAPVVRWSLEDALMSFSVLKLIAY